MSRRVVGREGVSYHIRLIVTLNQINGNPSIWAQLRGHMQLPNHVKVCECLYFIAIIYINYAHTQLTRWSPDRQE